MTSESFDYTLDGVDFDGVLVPAGPGAPTVLVFHGMEGRSDAQVEFCHRVAQLGYQAVAVDLFGTEATNGGIDATAAAMNGFLEDRAAMSERLTTVVDHLSALPGVDREAMAAMGFCFGGLCMLDLARHGTHLRSVTAFHGLLTALPDAPSTPIDTRISVHHGWDDPFAPPADVLALTAELTQRQADWQLHAYGNTVHAFMAPFANSPERGILFSESASRRAWVGFVDFLGETFAG